MRSFCSITLSFKNFIIKSKGAKKKSKGAFLLIIPRFSMLTCFPMANTY